MEPNPDSEHLGERVASSISDSISRNISNEVEEREQGIKVEI